MTCVKAFKQEKQLSIINLNTRNTHELYKQTCTTEQHAPDLGQGQTKATCIHVLTVATFTLT